MANQQLEKQAQEAEHVSRRPAKAPRVDVFENEHEYLILADVPGVTKDALAINVEESEILLEGTQPTSTTGALVAAEYQETDYRRKFSLPQGVDREKIEAHLADGVLRLRLPKSEALRPRQIPVQVGSS